MPRFVTTSCLGLCLTAIAATQLFAQEPGVRTPDRATQLRTSYSHQLIHRRAVENARQRTARLETRAWLGQSVSRPSYEPGMNSGDIFQRFQYGGPARYRVGRTNWYGPVVTE